jgi:hypothetical protein
MRLVHTDPGSGRQSLYGRGRLPDTGVGDCRPKNVPVKIGMGFAMIPTTYMSGDGKRCYLFSSGGDCLSIARGRLP